MSKRSAIQDLYPLTPMQEGMLFHTLDEEGHGTYVGQFSFALHGSLDGDALEQAWRGAVQRHDALRAAFAWEGVPRPVQVIRRTAKLPFVREDWRELDEAQQQARLEQYLEADRAAGFDVKQAPLMRLALFRTAETEYKLIWTHHHLILDGWSLSLIFRDVLVLYQGHLQGREVQLGSARPYREYVAWLGRQDIARAEHAWREALAGFTAPTPMPLDGAAQPGAAAGPGPSGHGEAQLHLDSDRTARLQAFARSHGLTVNTLIQAAWGLLLARYSGEADVVFGATVSGRPPQLPGAEEMVGLFINTLPVRVRARPEARVGEWLAELQGRQAALQEYEHTPLVQIQKWSEIPAGQPLFGSVFSFANYAIDGTLTDRDVGFRVESARAIERDDYPLFLGGAMAGDTLDLELVYHRSRHSAADAERLMQQLAVLLDQLAADPQRRLAEVTVLSAEERQPLLAAGRGAAAEYPREQCVHELISLRAAAAPGAVAVVCGEAQLGFGQLDERASRLAARLRRMGVGPETRVALLLDRSAELAVALLGVLKAGGAYVPLDPAYPAERLAYLIADSGARVVVTRTSLAERLPATTAETLLVDDADAPAAEAETVEPGRPDPDSLAYVIYTSGSTGTPKGVMVSHRSLVCYAEAVRQELGLTPDDRFLQFASPSFDVMVEETFPAWLSGAAVVFPQEALLESPEGLVETIDAQGVTALELPTAFWHEWVRMVAEDGQRLPASVRFVIVGGERVLPQRLAQWAQLGVPLVHVFGLTETTVSSTMLRLEAGEDGSRWSNLPVGRPLANVELYVLDAAMQPAPEGAPGELYIGGEAVARGYSGRPALTAERFVPDPFGRPGARLYRTGDRVRWLADGMLEFLGRIDEQVKVRGFRIEPGEIEAALTVLPQVREAVVMVREDVAGQRRLVAYVVPEPGAEVDAAELRAHLNGRLPEYMVPGAFVALERLPLTANGKIDRRALPRPEEGQGGAAAYIAPTSELEQTLCAIWAETLRVERVGVHDNYFELGGDSILAIQIVSRARKAGLRLKPRQLFLHPTVAQLVREVTSADGMDSQAEQGAVTGEVELTPVQRWFFEEEIPERHHWNMPLLLELRRPLDAARLETALRALVAHHDALRSRYARSADGAWTQTVAPADEPVALERVDLSGVAEAELAERIERRSTEAQASLDLAQGPLLRAVYFERGAGKSARLLLAVHHLVVDGVSWRILLEDLQTAYEQAERGEAVSLPAKTTSYQQWARRLAEHTARGGFDAELEYWLDEPRRMLRPLPVDTAGAQDTVASTRAVSVTLGAEQTRLLLQEVPAAYRTQVGDVLLCALARAFASWTGEARLLVDLEGHGREELFEDVDLSRTVGWFTTVYPVLLDLHGAAGEGTSLKRVKEQVRGIPHQGIGYGALRWLSAEAAVRDRLAVLPRAQVSFNHLGQVDAGLDEEGLFALAHEPAGEATSPHAPREHLLEVNTVVLDGQLRVDWSYGEEVHRRETVEALAAGYLAELERLIAHCLSAEAGGYTPSDFPLAKLSQDDLDRLLGSEAGVEDLYPLSPLQEGILFHLIYAQEDRFYLAQYGFELHGRLDAEALRHAWDLTLARHTALRASFRWKDLPRPLQVVHRQLHMPFVQEDWRALPAAEQEAALQRFLREDRARGIDPESPPLMRVTLFRTGEEQHRIVWSFLQVVLDGWSLPLVYQDLLAFYQGLVEGRPAALGAAPRHREYIAWVERQDPAREESFWREYLAGFDSPTPLPLERVGAPGGRGQRREQMYRHIRAAQMQTLQAFLRTRGLTPSTLVQGAWALLLGRYSGEEEVVFGTTVSGRPAELPGIEEMVGVFINSLPVRVRLAGDPRVGEWLSGLQEEAAALREHEHVPLSQVHRWSSLPAGQEMFESLFVFENYPVEEALEGSKGGVEVRGMTAVEQANYPLGLMAVPGARELMLRLDYDPERLDAAGAERILDQLAVALEELTADPGRRLGEVPLMREEERAQLLAGSRTAALGHPEACVHELLAARAARTPDAVAVVFGDEALTYAELEHASNRLAHHLRGRGVGPETRVGICLERGPEMVVGALGVLKAGGAYVPLDPAYPVDRLAYTLADSGAPVLVTRLPLLDGLPAFDGQVVCLDADREAIGIERDEAPDGGAGIRNAAYVIYTSGSTGTPKGVVVEHGNLTATLLTTRDTFGLAEGEVFPAMASYAFDIWAFEVFAPLLAGGQVRLLGREAVRDVERLAAEMAEVDGLHAVPLLMREVVERVLSGPGTLPRMKHVFIGGDLIAPELLERTQAAFPAARVWAMYGPTEGTIISSGTPLQRGPSYDWQMVGRPLPGVSMYVCDAGGELLPSGVPGELCLGGSGVARGYLGRPELTAERFVPDAFGGEPGARLYRTGDRVRRRADGELEFLGRVDAQVKIRGFRIEPGEIEAALVGHPAVREAVVAVREDVPGQRRLVAYVVPDAGAGEQPGSAELREHLSARLPEHMVPGAFVTLDRLPLNANGKVNRRALPAPERAAEAGYVAPRTEIEEILCAVWADVLRQERVGVHDSFFELGGDSILSIQVVSRARQRGLKLTPRQLFEQPTIARLAEVVEWIDTEAIGATQEVVLGEAPLTPVQARFFETPNPARHHFNQGLLLQPRERLEPALLARAAAALETHHDALRLRFRQGTDGRWTQEHAGPGPRSPLVVLDLSALPAEAQKDAVEAAAARVQLSLDLEHGPLLRMVWFELGADRPGRLLAVVHHLVLDGVSWRVLLEDLESSYGQLSRGEALQLPAKTTSWKAWAERLAEHARSAAMAEEAAYWTARAQLETAPLPVDDAAAENTEAQTRTVSASLGEAETGALLREVPAAYRTQIDEVLLTALAGALARWTGERRVRVELEGHGREEETVGGVDLSRTVGWFTSLYPVLLELPENGGPGAALKAVKEQLRGVPNRGIGYGLLRYLGADEVRAEMERAPEAEVGFNYLGQLDQAVSADAFLAFAPESPGPMADPRTRRIHRIEVDTAVRGGRLEVGIGYAEGVHRRETAERLAEWYVEELRGLIAHCTSGEAGGYTPSDFPLAKLDQAALDTVLGSERGIEDVYPLTPMQEGMLFHVRFAPQSGVYVGQFGFLLDGPLNVPALERAWQGTVARHQALRASFAWDGIDRPVQVIRREARVPFRSEDWRGLDEVEQEERKERFLAEDRAEGFDLTRAPLMRLALFRTGEEEHELIWTHHHTVLDGWSLSLLFRDVLTLYAAYTRGESPRLAEARRFGEYVAWLQRQDRARAEQFWREALAGFTSPTSLPLAPTGKKPGGGAVPGAAKAVLSEAVTQALQEQVRPWGVTTSTLVQGAWGLLLSRYAGEDDVVFGTTVSGRPAELAGVEEMVGLFINALPVRVQVDTTTTLRACLEAVQRQQVQAREFEFSPLVEVQKWSEVRGGEALFQSLVVFENYPMDEGLGEPVEGLTVRLSEGVEQANYPLVLLATGSPALTLDLRYDRELVDPRTAHRLVAHLQAVLEAMAADPERRLSELSLLRDAERVQLLETWNDTAADYPRALYAELFAEQAARTPDVAAVTSGDTSLTYAELERRSNQLAHHLRGRGVGPEVRVALYLDRSVELLVGVLGVLKAGGVYVPMDPMYPAERLSYILEDSGAHLLVTQLPLLDGFPVYDGEIAFLDADRGAIESEPAEAPPVEVEAGNAAYVIYTSGSTGKPKGVMVEHGSLAHFTATMRRTYEPRVGDVVPAMVSYAFDIWVFEALLPLVCGATVRVMHPDKVRDPAAVLGELRDAGLMNAVPALMRQIVMFALQSEAPLTTLRWVFSGGETVPPELWAEMRKAFPNARLAVLYGPTEATVLATAYEIPEDTAGGAMIGRPLPNVRVYVVDAWGSLLPMGMAGELYIGGPGVGRGYLGRPELTAERWVPDPFGGEAGARLYRTGDRVRWRADGELEFLGRMDDQVKVRGFRIELGEIEAVLAQHPQVRQAAAVVREDRAQKSLHAFVVPKEGEEVATAELRDFMSARVPFYMVPVVFIVLDEMPLNANGKVDRKALPSAQGTTTAYVAPRTAVEELLCELVRDLLNSESETPLERVGIHDNFFELGGHSLLATQFISRIKQSLGIEVPITTLFETHDLETFAAAVEQELLAGVNSSELAELAEQVGHLAEDELTGDVDEVTSPGGEVPAD